jgi:hypothetical protein
MPSTTSVEFPSIPLRRCRALVGLGVITLAYTTLASCKTGTHERPAAQGAQQNCPATTQVLADLKAMEGNVGALNSLSAMPDANDPTRCSFDLQLGQGSEVWATAQLHYERVVGRWRLVNDKPSFATTDAGFHAMVKALVEKTCACRTSQCLQGVAAMKARTLDSDRLRRAMADAPEVFTALHARADACTQRVLGHAGDPDPQLLEKTQEARLLITKMSDGARVYHATPAQLGAAQSLPESVGPSPPLGTCCADGGQCKANPANWNAPTWQALDFAVQAPHYYSYEFTAELTEEGKLSYSAIAHGDLDCDGVYSHFTIRGELDSNGEMRASEVLEDNPLE